MPHGPEPRRSSILSLQLQKELQEQVGIVDAELWASKYPCMCRCVHLRSAAALVCLNDLIIQLLPAIKGYDVYKDLQYNPVAQAWFAIASIALTLGVCSILMAWYGVWRKKSLWMLPKIVVKVFMIPTYIGCLCYISYLVYNVSPMVQNLMTELAPFEVHNMSVRSVVKLWGTILCGFLFIACALQFWFLCILIDAYRYVRKHELHIALREYYASLPKATRDASTYGKGRRKIEAVQKPRENGTSAQNEPEVREFSSMAALMSENRSTEFDSLV